MGKSLYGADPVFTSAFLRVLASSKYGSAAHSRWLSGEEPIDATEFAQPLIFATDYALAKMVISWGVRPSLLIGHSAGELVAAVLAGIITLRDGVRVMDDRVDQSIYAPSGGMLAVACSSAEAPSYTDSTVSIAADNAPRQIMLAGSDIGLDMTRLKLVAAGVAHSKVPALTPFHSPAMREVAERHLSFCSTIQWREPVIPVISGYTGRFLTGNTARRPQFWASQVEDPVLFRVALQTALEDDNWLFLETGARQTLTAFAKRHKQVRSGASVAMPLLPDEENAFGPVEDHPSKRAMLAAVGWPSSLN